jgi:hypothetical protein
MHNENTEIQGKDNLSEDGNKNVELCEEKWNWGKNKMLMTVHTHVC